MKSQAFQLDISKFRKIVAKGKFRLKKQVSQETIFKAISKDGISILDAPGAFQQFTYPHYQQRLRETLLELKKQQEERTFVFGQQSSRLFSELGWLNRNALQRLALYIANEDLNKIVELMHVYGIHQRFPDQAETFLNQLAKIYENLFKINLIQILVQNLHKQAEKNNMQNMKLSQAPFLLTQVSQLQHKCQKFRIFIKSESIQQVYESVMKIGLNSKNVIRFIESCTYPAFLEDLLTLLSNINSLNMNTKIFIELAAVYLFLDVEYYLSEEEISKFILSYYEDYETCQKFIQDIGLLQQPENHESLTAALGLLTDKIQNQKVKEIMIQEIKLYNSFLKELLLLKHHVKEIQSIVNKEQEIELIYGPEQIENQQSKIVIKKTQELFNQLVGMKPAIIVQEFKRITKFFILVHYKDKDFHTMRNLFNNEKDSSIYVINALCSSSSGSMKQKSSLQWHDQLAAPRIDPILQKTIILEQASSVQVDPENDRISKSQIAKKTDSLNQSSYESMVKKVNLNQGKVDNKDPQLLYLVLIIPQRACQKIQLRFQHEKDNETRPQFKKRQCSGQIYYDSLLTNRQDTISKSKVYLEYKNTQRQLEAYHKSMQTSGILIVNQRSSNRYLTNRIVFNAIRLIAQVFRIKSEEETIKQRVLNWLMLLADYAKLREQNDKNQAYIFNKINLKFEESPILSALFIYYTFFCFKEHSTHVYGVLKKFHLIQRFNFVNQLDISQKSSFKNLYRRLHLKKLILSSMKSVTPELKNLFNEALEIQPELFRPKYLQIFAIQHPSLVFEVNKKITSHMLSDQHYDIFDYIVIKTQYMKGYLEKAESQEKFTFFKDFVQEIKVVAIKQCHNSSQFKNKVICNLTAFIEEILVKKGLLFSRELCLNNVMLIQLYKRSKNLFQVAPQIANLLTGTLTPYMNLKEEDSYIKSRILALLYKPQRKHEQNKLRNFFRNYQIEPPLFKELVKLAVHQTDQNYEISYLHLEILDHIRDNPAFLAYLLEEKLFILEEEYLQTRNHQEKNATAKKLLKIALNTLGESLKSRQKKQRHVLLKQYLRIGNAFRSQQAKSMIQLELAKYSQIASQLQQASPISLTFISEQLNNRNGRNSLMQNSMYERE